LPAPFCTIDLYRHVHLHRAHTARTFSPPPSKRKHGLLLDEEDGPDAGALAPAWRGRGGTSALLQTRPSQPKQNPPKRNLPEAKSTWHRELASRSRSARNTSTPAHQATIPSHILLPLASLAPTRRSRPLVGSPDKPAGERVNHPRFPRDNTIVRIAHRRKFP